MSNTVEDLLLRNSNNETKRNHVDVEVPYVFPSVLGPM